MRILQVHNRYRYLGGEDIAIEVEKRLLEDHGHTVVQFIRNNREIDSFGIRERVALSWRTVWCRESYREIRSMIRSNRIDLVHVHNFFPLISPSVLYACRACNVPSVLSIHNYRLLCPAGIFYRNNGVCEDCVHGTLLSSVVHRCYHKSFVQTLPVAAMVWIHRVARTWQQLPNAIICMSDFERRKFELAGFPPLKLHVIPPPLPNIPLADTSRRDRVLMVGRLEAIKGVDVLLSAALDCPNIHFKLIGEDVGGYDRKVQLHPNVCIVPHMPHNEVLEQMRSSRILVMPSIIYETFGRSIVEAFACGTPVIASRLGAMAELVEEGKTGLLFEAGNSEELASRLTWAMNHKDEMARMGRNARERYVEYYSAVRNFENLMRIYEAAGRRLSTPILTVHDGWKASS